MYRPLWTAVHCRWGTSYTCPTDSRTGETFSILFLAQFTDTFFQPPAPATDVPTLILALDTLQTFNFTGHTFARVIQPCVLPYLNHDDHDLRLKACETCCALLGGNDETKGKKKAASPSSSSGGVRLVEAIRRWCIIRVMRALGLSLRCYKRSLGLLSL